MTLQTVTGSLSVVPPFDFTQSLKFLGAFKPAMGQQTISSASLTKAFYVGERVVVFQVAAAGSADQPELSYTLWSEQHLTEAERAKAADDISFFLSLSDDLSPFYAAAQLDPQFLRIINSLYGYHQVKFSLTAFENACWAVLSQRNPLTLARMMKDRLAEHYGGCLQVNGVTYRAFPLPSHLALAGPDALNAILQNSRKAECINAVAHAFVNIDEMWLREAPREQVESWLLSIKGIGAWSASFVLLRGLGHIEQLPIGEKRLLEAACRVYGRANLTFNDLPQLAAPYSAFAGYWAHYLRAGG